MNFKTDIRGDFLVISAVGDINLNSDVSKLYLLVESGLAQGKKDIALSFTAESFLYTRHIAVLVRALELIKDRGGSLTIINPNKDIADVLFLIDPDSLIRQAESEEALLALPASR